MPDTVLNTEITKITKTQFSPLKKISLVGSLDQQVNIHSQDDKGKDNNDLTNTSIDLFILGHYHLSSKLGHLSMREDVKDSKHKLGLSQRNLECGHPPCHYYTVTEVCNDDMSGRINQFVVFVPLFK